MSTLTFKALIDGVHFDPKKGAVKIQLIATSHVSMDKLTSLGPADESVRITLESAQTKITASPLVPEANPEGGGGMVEEQLDQADEDEAEEQLDQADEDEAADDEEALGDGLI